jgi:hypothetical protein
LNLSFSQPDDVDLRLHDWSRPGGMELLDLLFAKVLPPIKPAA